MIHGRAASAWLLACLVVTLMAAEPTWEPLPDPYGLGQRLVLIDRLRGLGIAVPEGASDEHLRGLYRRATIQTVAPTGPAVLRDGAFDEAARRRDAIARLRRTLAERHRIDAPADASEDDLRSLLAEQTRQVERRRQDDINQQLAQEQRRAQAEAAAGELITRTDGPSGITWVMPRLSGSYEERRSPYATCLFGRSRSGEPTPLELHLVVFLPEPPDGEPRISLRGGDYTLPLTGFSLTAAPTPEGPLRAEITVTVPSAGTREAIGLVLDQSAPRVEYHLGRRHLVVPIDDEQRSAIRAVLAAHAATP